VQHTLSIYESGIDDSVFHPKLEILMNTLIQRALALLFIATVTALHAQTL
jgi:hypothetical protein